MTNIECLILISELLIVFASWIYWGLITKFPAAFEDVKLTHGISSLFIHINHHSSRLSGHVVAGISLISGLGGLLTIITIGVLDKENDVGLGVSIFSAYTIVFFFVVEMWVLWQALRTNFEQGHVIPDFRALVQNLTEELRSLEDEIRRNYLNGAESSLTNQRLIIAAPHFLFGLMSFHGRKEFDQYIEALRAVFKMASKLETKKPEIRFPIKIIFGTKEIINDWHAERIAARLDNNVIQLPHNGSGIKRNEREKEQVDTLNRAFDKYIAEIFYEIGFDLDKNHFATTDKSFDEQKLIKTHCSKELSLPNQYYVRMKRDFEVQFMIVGGVLFEFTLNSQNDYTSIRDTQVVRDERTIRAYIAQFELLSRLALDESLIRENSVSPHVNAEAKA